MAEEKKTAPSGDGKDSNKMMMIMQLVFAVVNLGVVGGGAFLVYASTLGWHAPSITEKSLRNPASKKNAGHGKEAEGGGHGAPAPEAAGGHGAEEPEVVLFTQKLDKFTVNLDGEPRRTIRLEINLEMLNEESYEESMDASKMPKIRDRIVAILNEKSFSNLEGIQGKLFLKEKIATEINTILEHGVVKDVYFSEFVVQ